MGFLAGDSHLDGFPETKGNQDFLLPRRLVASGEVEDLVRIPSSHCLVRDSSLGVSGQRREVFFDPFPAPFVSRGGSGHPQLVGSSDGTQDCGSSVSNPGGFSSHCPTSRVVAETARTYYLFAVC